MPVTVLGQHAVTLPAGTTANRPTAEAGLLRFNTSSNLLEVSSGSSWTELSVFSPQSISGLIGWYDTTSVSGTSWLDKSGLGNHATIVGATVTATSGNGASFISSALHGSSTTHQVNWPTGVLPNATYTLLHVTRTTGVSVGRVYQGSGSNWLMGHWPSGGTQTTGVAYHNGWVNSVNVGHGNNWFISTDQTQLYRSNGVTRGSSGANTAGGSTDPGRLTINGLGVGESSTWMTAECIVYNRELGATEYGQLEQYLSSKYGIPLG